MRLSQHRILTSHVGSGSQPRPADLLWLLEDAETGVLNDPQALEARVTRAIYDIVARQRLAGVDFVKDGKNSNTSYKLYIQDRRNGVGRERVIASTNCGFATFAGPNNPVAPTVVWSKLKALAEGARTSSEELW